jgi:hypothetical protein
MASERLKRLSIDMPATLYRWFKMVEVQGTTAR